jgi:uncharacterized membrane protein YeaQ/YmgE (transglycosylase-associated protein family)
MVDPVITFLIVVVIGVAAGFIYDRYAGPGWLTRQVAGSRRGLLTYCLVGLAGSFLGFHIFALLGLGTSTLMLFIGAALGAAAVLWAWRTIK